jgi:cytochrome c-type biogenesis protein CcmF
MNPLLQDPAMALHPPMLYTGYVGFAVAFAYAIAAMLAGRVDQQWARWVRPWTTAAWTFLTLGIALGSWWAYYELGWGGWWFWDPVENASFMPWLIGTALIHSLAVTEKRDLFKGSTLLLAIGAFSLSLLGTFLVRSGVLVSVHAFASDPTRGVFILSLLVIVIGGALSIYAWRAPGLDRNAGFKAVSRETFLLINNILLSAATGLILLGTLYPLVLDALAMGKISVGKPYFDTVFIIPMLPLVIFAGIGMHAAWKQADTAQMVRKLRWLVVIALITGIMMTALAWGTGPVLTFVGVVTGIWLVLASLRDPVMRLFGKGPLLTASMIGMQIAHAGVGLFVIGVTVTSTYSIETDQSVRIGETVQVADYSVTFNDLQQVQGANYTALRADIDISQDGRIIAHLNPEKRVYRVQTMPMTEAGIDVGLGRDLFVALGEDLGDNAWSLRIQYKPMIRFIWLGCIVMALGGLIAMGDRRYRAAIQSKSPAVESGTATKLV